METFRRPKAPASHVAWLIALAATPHEGHSRSSLVGSLVMLSTRRWSDGGEFVSEEPIEADVQLD
mgnify:CR=1 FL=1